MGVWNELWLYVMIDAEHQPVSSERWVAVFGFGMSGIECLFCVLVVEEWSEEVNHRVRPDQTTLTGLFPFHCFGTTQNQRALLFWDFKTTFGISLVLFSPSKRQLFSTNPIEHRHSAFGRNWLVFSVNHHIQPQFISNAHCKRHNTLSKSLTANLLCRGCCECPLLRDLPMSRKQQGKALLTVV